MSLPQEQDRTRALLELLFHVSREVATALDLRTVLQRVLYEAIQNVGGERLSYDEVELPECLDGEFDDEAFARMQERWPLGHLAWVYGVERELLLQLHRMQGTRLVLNGSEPESERPLEHLLRGHAA